MGSHAWECFSTVISKSTASTGTTMSWASNLNSVLYRNLERTNVVRMHTVHESYQSCNIPHTISNVRSSRRWASFSIYDGIRVMRFHHHDKLSKCLHFYHPITASANNLICHKIDTVHLVCVTRKVCLDFVRLEIPNLCDSSSFFLMIDIPLPE